MEAQTLSLEGIPWQTTYSCVSHTLTWHKHRILLQILRTVKISDKHTFFSCFTAVLYYMGLFLFCFLEEIKW